MEAVLIYPHQLFENHPALEKNRLVFLVEDRRFFNDFNFHKQKLVFHRATLQEFQLLLEKKGYKTVYVENEISIEIKKRRVTTLYVGELDDQSLEKSLKTLCNDIEVKLEIIPCPGFMTSVEEFRSLFKGKTHVRFEHFYIYQRKKLGILLEQSGKPVGGKWSFDKENRKKAPKTLKIPAPFKAPHTSILEKAKKYVNEKYDQNPGSLESFNYPTTHADAKLALQKFLKERLIFFGAYEDAIVQNESILFHSCLSPLMNVGLLTPHEIVTQTLEFSNQHEIPLNSLEGFLRQVIGWREFIRGVYHALGKNERSANFFHHHRPLPQAFYHGNTGILPVDETIKKLHAQAYVHHIERLMVLGNFFLLCEISPDEIYRWFMELFIDAYDWVMVPNIYGMSQYADGGMMTTKPYFSSSNYILKMSDYPKGKWCEIWDALFWRFMIKHLDFFEQQPRLSPLCKIAKKKKHEPGFLKIAETFLKELK